MRGEEWMRRNNHGLC